MTACGESAADLTGWHRNAVQKQQQQKKKFQRVTGSMSKRHFLDAKKPPVPSPRKQTWMAAVLNILHRSFPHLEAWARSLRDSSSCALRFAVHVLIDSADKFSGH